MTAEPQTESEMKIENTTRYKTSDLRKFVTVVARRELDASKRKKATVKFIPARQQNWCSGVAWRGSLYCEIRIPTRVEIDDHLKVELAMVIAHELHHLNGRRGGRKNELAMRKSIPYGRPKTDRGKLSQLEFYSWAMELPVGVDAPVAIDKKTPEQNAREKRDHYALLLSRWESKKKRAETGIRKYKKKVRYYDGRIASMVSGGDR